ncbi:hypothetical protein BJ875DRAFT_381886 [Amylocarpus encephaloides]|uniref:DUF3844 domain-containing protein n=1 Tax=Amylocarpus encephaloides TaxID=45428 RepID=A0A9P7YF34_9HELO|nr:hypothetical protein BJ875DRAFT_381886 [Amylocarpus encephaloides]
MKLSISLLAPALIGIVSAASKADVYILQRDELPNTSNPTLSPEQARLVFAQRLGAAKYHDLAGASEDAFSHINNFGGSQESLFEDATQDKAAELILVVEGVQSKAAKRLSNTLDFIKPTFSISNPPSEKANRKLMLDLNDQLGQNQNCRLEDAINPFEVKCWNGRSKVINFNLVSDRNPPVFMNDLLSAAERLIQWARKEEMNTVVVLMPESARLSKSPANPYGLYEKVSQSNLGRRQASEEIISGTPAVASNPPATVSKQFRASNSSNTTDPLLAGVRPVCYSSMDSCNNSTEGCSGHGKCYKKYGAGQSACFTCKCVNVNGTSTGFGGPACQKTDVSGPFWLILISSVVMMGLVSWGIGMLFSIGEEKLPGVIGAGVSSSKAR